MASIIFWPLEHLTKLVIEDVHEHARQRPITVLIVFTIGTASFMITQNIYSIEELVDWIYDRILHVWTIIVRDVAQFFVDLIGSFFVFVAMFVVGVAEGIVDMWSGFKIPPIHVPKINIHF